MKWPWWKPLKPRPHQYQAAQFFGLEPDVPIADDVTILYLLNSARTAVVPFIDGYYYGQEKYNLIEFYRNNKHRYSDIKEICGKKYCVDWNTAI